MGRANFVTFRDHFVTPFFAYCLLVALREWAPHWRNKRIRLRLRTDNIAALTTLVRMQPHSSALGLIARELALDIATTAYAPDEAVHIPGLANKAADILSRLYGPSPPPLPDYLPEHLCHRCSPRPRGWWRSLAR